ncbi:MAG: ABC transporter substrate-binding protein [Rhodospirillaceae bacterium]|nr:ABC transporter substrate-binding protein [Rhodospirillaceae bacterium]
MLTKKLIRGVGLAAVSAIAISGGAAQAQDATKQDTIKIAVAAFLSGGAAGPFGVPGRNGAELVIDAINAGKLPAPYAAKGFGGATAEGIFFDESGGATKQVAEYRNLVQKRGVNVVIGYVGSGNCIALSPVADELKTLTIFSTCGTPRIFEESPRSYVFRSMSHATADNIAAAHYVADKFPNLKGYTGINQNYSWGQDSWRDFDLTLQTRNSSAKASEKLQFPKIFAGQYGTEISALSLDKSELVHSSFWGGDLEAFVIQGGARGLFKKKTAVLTVGGAASYRLGKRMPDNIILGDRGPYGILVRDRKTALNTWFINAFKDRYGTYPSGPAYHYAQSILATKVAYDKAAASAGMAPTQEQVVAALKGATFESFSTTVDMALGNGHQAITEAAYGITRYNNEAGEPALTDVKFFPAKCVMPPDGVTSVDWIKGGMKGATCS